MIQISLSEVTQIHHKDAVNLPKGSVIIVRSDYKNNVYFDHPSLIVGGTIKKERGIRPNLITFPPHSIQNIGMLIDQFEPIENKILLLLTSEAASRFMEDNMIHLSEGELIEVDAVNKLKEIFKD